MSNLIRAAGMMAGGGGPSFVSSWSLSALLGNGTTFSSRDPRANPYFGLPGDVVVLFLVGNATAHASSLATWTNVPVENMKVSSSSGMGLKVYWRKLDGSSNDVFNGQGGTSGYDMTAWSIYRGFRVGVMSSRFLDDINQHSSNTRSIPGYTPSSNGRAAIVLFTTGTGDGTHAPALTGGATRRFITDSSPTDIVRNKSLIMADKLAYTGGNFDFTGLTVGGLYGTAASAINIFELE